jgi:hypothetical protein
MANAPGFSPRTTIPTNDQTRKRFSSSQDDLRLPFYLAKPTSASPDGMVSSPSSSVQDSRPTSYWHYVTSGENFNGVWSPHSRPYASMNNNHIASHNAEKSRLQPRSPLQLLHNNMPPATNASSPPPLQPTNSTNSHFSLHQTGVQPLSLRLSMPFRTAFSQHNGGQLGRGDVFRDEFLESVFQLDRPLFGFNDRNSAFSLNGDDLLFDAGPLDDHGQSRLMSFGTDQLEFSLFSHITSVLIFRQFILVPL